MFPWTSADQRREAEFKQLCAVGPEEAAAAAAALTAAISSNKEATAKVTSSQSVCTGSRLALSNA